MEKAGTLARHFEVVAVPPPDEAETVRIAMGVKQQYEQFHGVTIADEAIDAAVAASRWFLRHRQLPDRVIDLLDEAAAYVKLKRPGHRVTADNIVETVAACANVTPQAVRNAMRVTKAELNAELIARELASQLPSGRRELAEALVTHLAGCSSEEAEQLITAIRAAKARIESTLE
jgi:ATP-dependent Clp protease ATP-binding subunit ClpA